MLASRLRLGAVSALRAASARSLCTLPELVTTRSGLRYRDVGTPNAEAPMPKAGDTVAVHCARLACVALPARPVHAYLPDLRTSW